MGKKGEGGGKVQRGKGKNNRAGLVDMEATKKKKKKAAGLFSDSGGGCCLS